MVVLTSFPPPEEGVRHRQENTEAHVQGRAFGPGTLFIAESRVSWLGASGRGFSLEYKAISLHAISRDSAAFPHHCLYLMVDGDLKQNEGAQNGSTESSSDEDESSKVSEIRFVPAIPEALEDMYKQMSECTILHPDDNCSLSGDDLEDAEEGYFESEEGLQELTPEGQATLSRLEAMLDPGDDGIGGEAVEAEDTVNSAAPANEEPMEAQFDDAES